MNIFDLLFPKRCVGCGKLGQYFCPRCRGAIRPIATNEAICPMCERAAVDGATHLRCSRRYALDGLTSFFRYDGVVRKAVKTLKYRLVSDLATEFVALVPQESLVGVDAKILVPIPLHTARFRFRGFNQAEVLGRLLAAKLHIPVETAILRRVKTVPPQVSMKNKVERLGNMQNVFRAANTGKNNTIILFDDVFTTGATMRSAANALKRAGTRYVWAVTMAR